MRTEIIPYSKEELGRIGISVARLLPLITKIDEDCDPNNPDASLLEEPFDDVVRRLTPVFEDTADMWSAFIDESKDSAEEKVVGYWNCVALTDTYQKLIEDGKLLERYINPDNLKPDLTAGTNELLFDSVCLHKDYQGGKAGLVMRSIYNTLKQLPAKGVNVGNVWASVWSKAGLKFFETRLGFVRVVENRPDGVDSEDTHYIYRISFQDLIRNLERCLEAYQ